MAGSLLNRRVLVIGGLIAVIIALLLIFSGDLVAPVVSRKIKAAVLKGSDSLYQVSFSALHLNIFTGTAELVDASLIVDTALLLRRQGLGTAPAKVFAGRASRVLVSGLHPFRYWFNKKLEVGQLVISDPRVSLSVYKGVSVKSGRAKTLYEMLSGEFKLISVGSIRLEHAQLGYVNYRTIKPEALYLRELTLVANDLLIDSATQRDKGRTLYCRDITTTLRNFSGVSADGIYRYKLRSAEFSTLDARVVVRGASLAPLPPAEFFVKSKEDRFSMAIDSMVVEGFNYRSFLRDHFLLVKRLRAFRGSLGIFSNPHGVLQRTDRIITYPNYIIRKLKTHFTVDTLDLAGIDVNYSEFNQDPGKTGTIDFKDTRARFLNITNQEDRLKVNGVCKVKLSSYFMGRAKLSLAFKFNLTDKVYGYAYSGHLAPMPLVAVNTVLRPLALGEVKKGELRSLDFSIAGDQSGAKGNLSLLYNDLSIALLNINYGKKVIKSFIANTFVVKPDNPDVGSKLPRFAKVVFIRPKNYPFFKSLWFTLLSGIKPCAGVGYAVKPDPAKLLSKKEQKAKDKALRKAIKAKEKADKQFKEQLKKKGLKQ
ncbi:MAG: hypothetical protein M3O71_15770 [Bacteroidota bacterium]|nr:hypothetical protein [Bacteroidota bacterium]